MVPELLPWSSPVIFSIPPVSPEAEKLNYYRSLVSSRSYFPIIIYLSQIPLPLPVASIFLSLLGYEMSGRHIQTPSLGISAGITNESCHSFLLSLHTFGQPSEHNSRKSIPIRVGTVCCRHFVLTHSPLTSMLWRLTFLNNRGWQPVSCIFQTSF